MCGILVSFRDRIDGFSRIKRISHRGNRKPIFKQQDGINFFHTRLAVQGLNDKYNQPYNTEDEIILYNGEVFNFKELDPSLECDTPLFIGEPRYDTFDGFFAVVKYNKETKEMKVATDKFGQKQLYYKMKKGRIVGIASEIKALVDRADKINYQYLARVNRFGYSSNSRITMFRGIYRFLPGKEYNIVNRVIKNFKDIKFNSSKLCRQGNLESLIKTSVERRLTSDIPVSLLLSGGIDSSIVLYHAKKINENIKIFTVENEDDIEHAEKLTEEWGLDLTKVSIRDVDPAEYKRAHLHNESAVDLGSVIPQYRLCEKIKEAGYNVVLTGDVADNIFLGYGRNQLFDHRYHDIFDELVWYDFPRLDRMSMAHTVELRSPFAAQYIIDYSRAIPYKESIGKKYLRKTYKNKLPDYILDRPKKALKVEEIRKDKRKEREKLIKLWLSNYKEFVNG